jgi:hypothetical protein
MPAAGCRYPFRAMISPASGTGVQMQRPTIHLIRRDRQLTADS